MKERNVVSWAREALQAVAGIPGRARPARPQGRQVRLRQPKPRKVAVRVPVHQVRARRRAAAGPAAAHGVRILRAVPDLREPRRAAIGAREAHAVAVQAPVPQRGDSGLTLCVGYARGVLRDIARALVTRGWAVDHRADPIQPSSDSTGLTG